MKRSFLTFFIVLGSICFVNAQVLLSVNFFALFNYNEADSANYELASEVAADYKDTALFVGDWNTEVTHLDSIDLSEMNDSIWLSLADESHPHFVVPVEGELRDTYRWRTRSRHHNGVDVALNTGDTVYAAFDGMVRYAKYNYGGYGNLVIIRHYNGLETYYGHFSKILADTNQYVKAGTPIGLGGSTGRSTGPHLHFEIRYLGNPINPEEIIDWECASLQGYEFVVHRDLFKHIREQKKRAYYRVKRGDTLSAIARRNGTTVKNICRLSGIKSTSTIRPGQSLRVR